MTKTVEQARAEEANKTLLSRFAILGAAGDLTSRLLMPALANLLKDGLLPDDFTVTGMGLEPLTTGDFREAHRRNPR